MFWIRGRRSEFDGCLLKMFSLTVPKKFVEEPLKVSLISGIEESDA